MLNTFDWLRICRAGGELLATLQKVDPQTGELTLLRQTTPGQGLSFAPPISALHQPCQRCWMYQPKPKKKYCLVCDTILAEGKQKGMTARRLAVIWAYLNRPPRPNLLEIGTLDALSADETKIRAQILGAYQADENRFLLLMSKRALQPWLQKLALYHGPDLRGLIQIFPTMGLGQRTDMADVLCRAIHHEARFSMDQLRVRFYSEPKQVVMPMEREQAGLLTFDLADFMSLLEMVALYKTMLLPTEQALLHQVLTLPEKEKAFYWGRLLGEFRPEVRDLLSTWQVRTWPQNRVTIIYELIDYVAFH